MRTMRAMQWGSALHELLDNGHCSGEEKDSRNLLSGKYPSICCFFLLGRDERKGGKAERRKQWQPSTNQSINSLTGTRACVSLNIWLELSTSSSPTLRRG
jgi:hypothetical protein